MGSAIIFAPRDNLRNYHASSGHPKELLCAGQFLTSSENENRYPQKHEAFYELVHVDIFKS